MSICHAVRDVLEKQYKLAVWQFLKQQRLKAGVRSIEHGTFIDNEGIQLMLQKGVYLIPTLAEGEYYLNERPKTKAPEKYIKLSKKYKAIQYKKVTAAIKAVVKVCVGSDYVGFPPAYSAREFSILVEQG